MNFNNTRQNQTKSVKLTSPGQDFYALMEQTVDIPMISDNYILLRYIYLTCVDRPCLKVCNLSFLIN